MKVYQAIARTFKTTWSSLNQGHIDTAEDRIKMLIHAHLPSGSGFDAGCKLLDESTPEKLVFSADFHHLSDRGYYIGWSEHKVIVRPCLAWGFTLKVTGRDRRDIKDYIAETFHYALNQEASE